jgi:hypothetical protein
MRLTAFAAGLFLAFTGLAAAQPFDTPEGLIEAFYAPYFSQEFAEDDEILRSAALQALYDADAEATPEGEIGALSFDPYISGQDWDLSDFEIGAAEIAGETATLEVSFENFGEPSVLTYDLVVEDGGWRIDDVLATTPTGEYRLSEIFLEAQYGP